MDLRSFKLHRHDRHVRAVVVDPQGEQARDLVGPAFDRVEAVAAPLWPALAARAGAEVRAISVDAIAGTLRASHAGPDAGLVLSGQDFWDMADRLAPIARAVLTELRVRGPDLPGATPSDPAFWDHLYVDTVGGWELERPTPALARWFARHPPVGLRTLVVGCGRGHEARLLAGLGARVTAIDLAPAAIDRARAATDPALGIDYAVRDLFTLAGAPPAHDLVVEHCCFCAIEPRRRDEYVDAVADALGPGGALVGLFYAHGKPGGPPFTVDAAELAARFERRFAVASLAPAEGSALIRHGHELLGHFTRS